MTENYYKDADSVRYKTIREEKLNILNTHARKQYYYSLFLILFFLILIIPFLQALHFLIDYDCWEQFFVSISMNWISLAYTLIISVISITYFVNKNEDNDVEAKIDIFRTLIFKVIFISLLLLSIPYFVWILLIKYEVNMFPAMILRDTHERMYYILSLLAYNVLFLLFLNIYHYLLKRLPSRIEKSNERFIYLYWVYFIKSTILYDPKFLIGIVVFIFLTIVSGFIIKEGGRDMGDDNIKLLGYLSFWFTAFIMSTMPFVQSLVELSKTFEKYSTHIIKDIIFPVLKGHVIIIGSGNLGSLLLKNCFFDIHPEGYGTKSICYPSNMRSKPDNSDYHAIIDGNLDLFIVSRRILILEKCNSNFKQVFDINDKFLIGILPPGTKNPKSGGIMVIGICGDANDPYVLSYARSDNAELIINTNLDPNLSVELAKLAKTGSPKKQILTITNTPSFESLTLLTYDNPVYLIDTQHIEGVSISQRVIMWVIKYIKVKHKGIPAQGFCSNVPEFN